MDLPKFHETFMPILEVLADNQVISANKIIIKKVDADFFDELCYAIFFLWYRIISTTGMTTQQTPSSEIKSFIYPMSL